MGPFQHALDDGNAKLLLKLADAPRKRGLGDVASLRRPGEMLLAGQRREILNLTDVHGGRLAGKGREGKGEDTLRMRNFETSLADKRSVGVARLVDSQPKTCKSQMNRLPERGGKRD